MMMTEHVPEQNERPSGVRSRRPTFVIATEGEKTEPDYFAYMDRLDNEINIILLPANDGQTQPSQVLDKLLRKKQELEKKEITSYQYWIVIDHDGRARAELEQVLQDADANQISVADSNPCFEAWLIQHFSSLTEIVELSNIRPVRSCDFVTNKHLRQFDRNYRKGSLDSTIYMPKIELAIQNAEHDELIASDLDEYNYNGSRVQKLVKKILCGD